VSANDLVKLKASFFLREVRASSRLAWQLTAFPAELYGTPLLPAKQNPRRKQHVRII